MYHVIRPWEARAFRECRRAWDFGSRERQDLEPAAPRRTFDFDEAMHDALEIYYFPGMWDWNRTIVRPLAVQAFSKAMRRQRDAYAAHRALTDAQRQEWQRYADEGVALLQRYFGWAATVDDELSAVQVSVLFDITVPDPTRPEAGLCTPGGQGIWYRVRIELVVTDVHGRCWLVEHRIVPEFSDLRTLLLDEQSLTRAWAWEIGFLGRLEGIIYNELLTGTGSQSAEQFRVRAVQGPSGLIKQQGGAGFRRTHIPRSPAELARRGLAVGHEIMDMTDPGLRLYPNPAASRCGSCDFQAPCMAMNQGEDVGPMLQASFRPRAAQDFEPGRLGSVWGFGPGVNEIDEYRAARPGDG